LPVRKKYGKRARMLADRREGRQPHQSPSETVKTRMELGFAHRQSLVPPVDPPILPASFCTAPAWHLGRSPPISRSSRSAARDPKRKSRSANCSPESRHRVSLSPLAAHDGSQIESQAQALKP